MAKIFFLIKKKVIYGKRYKHIFHYLAAIDCSLVDLDIYITFFVTFLIN